MKILMISESGDGFGIAHKLVAEGHEVKVYVKDRKYEHALIDLVNFVNSWRPVAADWADFVFADIVGFGHMAKVLDKFEVPHLGFSIVGDTLELDRQRQMELFRKFKITIPTTYDFESPSEAREMLESIWTKNTTGWAIKPSGNIETGKTFVVKDKPTMLWALEQYAPDQELIAQAFVNGVEISTEGWFSGTKWLEPFNHTMEEKRFLAGDLGPNTGCQGNVVWAVNDPKKDYFVQQLKKLTPFLKAAKYRGPIDLNMIANSGGAFGLELTTRFGYDAIEALYEIMSEPLGKVLFGLAMGGRKGLGLRPNTFGVAVRLTVPPYPHDDPDSADRGLPVLGIPNNAKDQRHFFFTDIYKDGPIYRWAAADGVLLKATGADRSLDKAIEKTYNRVEQISVQGLQYRSDIGARVSGNIEKLKAWGHLEAPWSLLKVVKRTIGGTYHGSGS